MCLDLHHLGQASDAGREVRSGGQARIGLARRSVVTAEVSYTKAGDRRLLRFALWQAWGMKCYWCDTPKSYLEVEIDHIVPKRLSKDDLKQALTNYGLPVDFDLQDPRNLAPICDPCNGPGRKGSHSYGGAAVVLDHLRKASELRGAVVRTVLNFRKGGDVAKAFLELASSDTGAEEVRALFVEYFPAVASTAATIDPRLLDRPTYRELTIDCGFPVRVDLDHRFTRELWFLETLLDCDLTTTLERPLADLMRQLAIEMDGELQRQSEFEPVDVGPPVPYAFDVRVTEIRFPRNEMSSEFEVEATLTFDGGLTSSASRYSDDGAERLELQGEVVVSGTALVSGTWLVDDGFAFSEDVIVEHISIDAWLE
jgi:5-methylcytosine-specific restriction endonuclease McrA